MSTEDFVSFQSGKESERRRILQLLEKEHRRLSAKEYKSEEDKLLMLLGLRLAIDVVKYSPQEDF